MTYREEVSENRRIAETQRQRYLGREISFEAYYLWLANFIGVTPDMIPATETQLWDSTDPNLNDIPLRIWDSSHFIVQQMALEKRIGWSQSDTVCVLKNLARIKQKSPDFIAKKVIKRMVGGKNDE